MLGRPVVRRLTQDGFPVRLLARRPGRAARWFGPGLDIAEGGLGSLPALDAALQDCHAAYLSVDSRYQDRFRPETDGLRNLIDAARNHPGVRLMVLSAIGCSDPAALRHPWWHVREKARAQAMARESGLAWTIFEPTWFMESLPLFVKKGTFALIRGARLEPYWIAGDDYARMISAALTGGRGVEEVVPAQGPEKLSLDDAARVFIAAYDRSIRVRTVPLWALKMAGWFNREAKEFATVLEETARYPEPAPDEAVWNKYARPAMDIAAYAAYVRRTGDFPQK